MTFATFTCELLKYYTTTPPATVDVWYGPWNNILQTLFPSDIVTYDPKNDFFMEVQKISTGPPLTYQSVLIVKFRNSEHWESGIPALQSQLNRDTDVAFTRTAQSKIYWIESIGPHWRYGEKNDDGQVARPLIDWHDTIHDQDSFDDFQTLARLVAAL